MILLLVKIFYTFYIFKNIVKMFESHVKAVDDVQIVGVNRK